MDSAFWQQLLTLGVFSVFVMSLIEVVKGISAKGLFSIFVELFKSLLKNENTMSGETLQTINFAIALTCCAAFKYGVMASLLKIDITTLGEFARWIDYLGTSALVYNGAGAMFDKFSQLREGWQKASGTPTP